MWNSPGPPTLFLSSCRMTEGILANAFMASRHEGEAELPPHTLTVRKAVAWNPPEPPALFLSSCRITEGIFANAFMASRQEGHAEQLSLHTCCTLQPDAAWQLVVVVMAEQGC